MITAEQARAIASLKSNLKNLFEKIEKAAKEGEDGIWVENLTYSIHDKLRSLGYEITVGGKDHNGIDRRGQTWIWWGY